VKHQNLKNEITQICLKYRDREINPEFLHQVSQLAYMQWR